MKHDETKPRKLRLSRETLRRLDADTGPKYGPLIESRLMSCFPTCSATCVPVN